MKLEEKLKQMPEFNIMNVDKEDSQAKQHLEEQSTLLKNKLKTMKEQRDKYFELSDMSLVCIATCLQNALTKEANGEEGNLTEELKNLKFTIKPDYKLYVVNPPYFKLPKEVEERVKKRWTETLKNKENATV